MRLFFSMRHLNTCFDDMVSIIRISVFLRLNYLSFFLNIILLFYPMIYIPRGYKIFPLFLFLLLFYVIMSFKHSNDWILLSLHDHIFEN